jgi:hypothetical protein
MLYINWFKHASFYLDQTTAGNLYQCCTAPDSLPLVKGLYRLLTNPAL